MRRLQSQLEIIMTAFSISFFECCYWLAREENNLLELFFLALKSVYRVKVSKDYELDPERAVQLHALVFRFPFQNHQRILDSLF